MGAAMGCVHAASTGDVACLTRAQQWVRTVLLQAPCHLSHGRTLPCLQSCKAFLIPVLSRSEWETVVEFAGTRGCPIAIIVANLLTSHTNLCTV